MCDGAGQEGALNCPAVQPLEAYSGPLPLGSSLALSRSSLLQMCLFLSSSQEGWPLCRTKGRQRCQGPFSADSDSPGEVGGCERVGESIPFQPIPWADSVPVGRKRKKASLLHAP